MKFIARLFAYIYICIYIAAYSGTLLAQTNQTWSPYAWGGAYLSAEYLAYDNAPERVNRFYTLAKTSFGATPTEACRNGYIANFNFLKIAVPTFEMKTNAIGQDYDCLYKTPEYERYDNAFEATARALCTSLSFELFKLDLEAQGGEVYDQWRREWVRGIPRNTSSPYYTRSTDQCQCGQGAKLHSSQQFCVKIPDIVIGFFNGVANTEKAASQSAKRLEAEYGDKYKDTPLKYELFYNQTACGSTWFGAVSCLEDIAETFEQRSKELDGVFANRWEVFWDILAGRHRTDGSLTGRMFSLLDDGANALLQWLDSTANAVLNQLASSVFKLLTLFTSSPNYENRTQHLEQLQAHVDRGSGLVMVAHSQGNLFVNSAYDALLAAKPNAEAKVVHVAPASPTLRGDYVLADIDLVINVLRTAGINTVQPININLPFSSVDATGHGFEPTYMDKARAAYASTKVMITNSLQALVP